MHEYDLSDLEQRNQAAGEYVLGCLSPAEKAKLEALMAVSHDLQVEVQHWRECLDVFNTDLAPVKPPASVWKNISASTKVSRSIWSLKSFVGFSFAVMLSIGLFLQWPQDQTTAWVPLIKNAQQEPGWVMNISMKKQQLVVESQYPVIMPADSVYEIWLMSDAHEPMSLGFLPASGKRVIPFAKAWADLILTCVVVITMEGLEGAPDGNNMGPVSDKANWKSVSF